MRKNVIFKLVSPIYPLLCEGHRNEDCRYALLLLALEVVSFILDLLGGSRWSYLFASFLLSVLILETTIYAYFIKRSRIKSEAQQLIAVEIVSSVLQLMQQSMLSLLKAKKMFHIRPQTLHLILHQLRLVRDIDEFVFSSIRVDPPDIPVDNVNPVGQMLVSEPKTGAEVEPVDPTLVCEPKTGAEVEPVDPTLVSEPTSGAEVEPVDPTLDSHSSVNTPYDSQSTGLALCCLAISDNEVAPWDESLVSVPTSDAEVDSLDEPLVLSNAETDPLDEPLVSAPTSDAQVDPLREPLVSVPSSSASIQQADTLRQRRKHSHLLELLFKVDLPNDKAKNKAMRTLSYISGVEKIEVDMEEQDPTLTATREVDPGCVLNKLRKRCITELISIGPPNQPRTAKQKKLKQE